MHDEPLVLQQRSSPDTVLAAAAARQQLWHTLLIQKVLVEAAADLQALATVSTNPLVKLR